MGEPNYPSHREVYRKFRDFASFCFTKRQKLLLEEVSKADRKANATNFVLFVSKKYSFSETSAWHNLKKFRKMGLVDFGNSGSKGKFLMLTYFGKILKGGEKNG